MAPNSHEVTDRRLGTEGDARRLLFRLKFFLGGGHLALQLVIWEEPQPSKKTGAWPWGSGPRAAGGKGDRGFLGISLLLCPGQGFSKCDPQTSPISTTWDLVRT